MRIDGTGNLGRELRQLAGDLEVRRQLEESSFDQKRMADLSQLIILAADMADDVDGVFGSKPELTQELSDGMFDDILYREYPDGPVDPNID